MTIIERLKLEEEKLKNEKSIKEICKQKFIIEKLLNKLDLILNIYNYLKSRNVEYFIHFTPTENLKSIKKYGIVPKDKHNDLGITSVVTDSSRYEGNNHSNFSISFPNSAMLYSKINNQHMNISILKISIDVLFEEGIIDDICYTEHNAASSDAEKLYGLEGLKKLFADELKFDANTVKRNISLPKNNTTDYQAEVLIGGIVPCTYISEIVVQSSNKHAYSLATKIFETSIVVKNDKMFSNRIDQYQWIKERNYGYQTGIYGGYEPTIFCA